MVGECRVKRHSLSVCRQGVFWDWNSNLLKSCTYRGRVVIISSHRITPLMSELIMSEPIKLPNSPMSRYQLLSLEAINK